MRVVYLIAAQPNALCGVADYTRQLSRAVKELGVGVSIEKLPSWSLYALAKLFFKYLPEKECIFHLQYPTLGMGRSFAPALLPFLFGRRAFVTLHEFEQFSVIRKLYFLPPAYFAKNFLFTNEGEQKFFSRFFSKKSVGEVIPIGNNIGVFPAGAKPTPRERLIYFGQIAPGKGVEDFIETVRLLRGQHIDLACAIIGALLNAEGELARKVLKAAKDYGIEGVFDASNEKVSQELQESTIALLPFPQGVGDKRGSALACLKHGTTLLTKHAALTPEWWRKTTYAVENPTQAARIVRDIIDERLERHPNAQALAAALQEREWSAIAQRHIGLYAQAIGGNK